MLSPVSLVPRDPQVGGLWFKILFALVVPASCTHLSAETPTLSSRIYDVSIHDVTLAPGLSEHRVQVEGRSRRFAVWVPAHGVGKGHPLFLYLHGAVQDPDFHAVECQFRVPFESLAPIVIAPVAPGGRGGRWWKEEEASFALGLLRAAVQQWPVDPQKVVLLGYSNGGIGTWAMARAYPQYFTAAIPMAFNHTVVGPVELPTFAIQGEGDELFGSTRIAKAVQQLRTAQHDVTLAIRPGGSHFKPCDYGAELHQASNWLEKSVWSSVSTGSP